MALGQVEGLSRPAVGRELCVLGKVPRGWMVGADPRMAEGPLGAKIRILLSCFFQIQPSGVYPECTILSGPDSNLRDKNTKE